MHARDSLIARQRITIREIYMTLKSFVVRVVTLLVLVAAAIYAIIVLSLGRANAMPDPYTPIPGYWCQGGGGQFGGFGGFCDGAAYPDGTHWHIANGMGVWLPAVCTYANGTTDPAPGRCGQ